MPNERIITNDFTPALSPGDGATSENGRVKQSELVADFDDVSYAIFAGRFYVEDRASDANNCDIWLENKSGTKQGCVAGEKAYIYYASGASIDHMWTTDVVEDGGDPYIRFSDADCETPASPSITYNNAGFIAAIIVVVQPVENLIEKDRIVVVGDGALTGDDIARSAADTTKLATKVTTLETQADSVIETAGGLKSDVVEASNVKKTGTDAAFENDLPKNILLDGSCERFIYRYDVAYGLDETTVAASSYAEETTIVKHGDSSQEFVTAAGGVGLKVLIDPEEGGVTNPGASQTIGKDLQGKNITIACWYRGTVANNVEIGIWDDVGGYDTTVQTVAANTWTLISITKTVDAAAVEVYGIIRSSTVTATTHYVDAISVFPGETAFEIGLSVNSSVVHNQLDNRVYNFIPFGDLRGESAGKEPGHAWLEGDTSPPTGWTGDGVTAVDDTDYYVGERSWQITLGAGEYFSHTVGLSTGAEFAIQQLVGRHVTFSLWLKDDGVDTEDLDLMIEENTGSWATVATASFPVESYDDWQQVAVTAYISPSATAVLVRIKNSGAARITALIDGLMFTQTEYPIQFTSISPWQYIKFEFGMSGSLTDSLMDCQGITGHIPIGICALVYGITVTEQASGTGDDVFTVYEGGGSTPLSVTLGNGEDYESASGNWNYFSAGDTIGVYCNADSKEPGKDAFAVVHAITWGI